MKLGRAMQWLRPHRTRLGVAALLLTATAAIPAAAVWVLERALQRVVTGNGDGLMATALAFVGLYLLHAVLSVTRTALTKGVAWEVATTLRAQLHGHYLSSEPSGAIGDRLAAVLDEVDQVQYGISAAVTAVRDPLTLFALAGSVVLLDPRLGAVAAVLLVPVVVVAWGGGVRVRNTATRARHARADLHALAQEQLAGLATIRAFGVSEVELEGFEALSDADRRARLTLEVERPIPSLVVRVVAALAVGTLLVLGGGRVTTGALTPSELVALIVALGLMASPLGRLAEVWSLLQRALASLERVERELAQGPERAASPTLELPPGPLTLAWSAATVAVEGRTLLHGVDLSVGPGTLLALVGPTGAGKTTLLRSAHGAMPLAGGTLQVGGLDVREVSQAALNGAIAVVEQEAFLFARTIRDNLRLGRPDAVNSEIEHALELAGASFVAELPAGLDTVLDERARRLSGGERQRLCLARALLTGARVLLLDEPTSHVDPETTAELVRALQTCRRGRVVIVVAHDPAVASSAGQVAVIEDGRIVEQGSPQVLRDAGGPFAAWLGEDRWSETR